MGIAIVWAKASPSGSRADHSLHGLWQSQTPKGAMALFGDSVDCRFFSINTSMFWYVVQLSSIFLVRALFIFTWTWTACTRGTLPPKWKSLSRSSGALRRQGWYTHWITSLKVHWIHKCIEIISVFCVLFSVAMVCVGKTQLFVMVIVVFLLTFQDIPRYRKVIGHWRRCSRGSDGGYWGDRWWWRSLTLLQTLAQDQSRKLVHDWPTWA